MPSPARFATAWLLGLATAVGGASGCHRTGSSPTPASEPAGGPVVVQARTAAATAHVPEAGTPSVVSTREVAPPVADAPEVAAGVSDDPNAGCLASVDELPASDLVDRSDRRLRRDALLVADKSARRLMLFSGGNLQACWRVGLGFSPEGHKAVEGDGRTPEGWYATSDKPWSTFEDAIAIHYPNDDDADAALADGRISRRTRDLVREATARRAVPPQRTAMGGAVLIHGGGSRSDWTLGCIALDEGDLGDLRSRLPRRMKTDLLVLP